jgi:lysozyme family protein
MSSDAFPSALRFVLRWEGGFVDDPQDPGGRTNKGVTQKTYDAWLERNGSPAADVRNISDAEVHSIYASDYWIPPRCDLLTSPLDLVQFDTAVNMGIGRAVRFLQSALGCGVDGDFGPNTRRAVDACDPGSTLVAYCDAREAFYRRLAERKPALQKFLKGWLNRLNALRAAAGLPGLESTARGVDFGDAGFIRRIPDIGEDPAFDL